MSVVENTREQLLSSGSWSVDPAHSTIEFRVKHMLPSVSGSIRVASLETLHEERDAHLRSPDFFEAERYPEIDFRAAGIQFNSDHTHVALPGELTIKGVTRPIVLDGELLGSAIDGDGRERIAFALRGQLNRSDYGLVWNRVLETGNVVVGEAVDLILDIAAVRVG